LPDALKKELVKNNYVGCHTLAQSRKLGSPEYFKKVDPTKFPMARHHLVQIHEGSGRVNLYIGAHLHHIEGLSEGKSNQLRDTLKAHATQPKYVYNFNWEQPSDIIMWDNRALLHRAVGGSFAGKYRRDLRRTTVHDDSANAWGLNDAEGTSAIGYAVSGATSDTAEFTAADTTTPVTPAIAAKMPAPVPV
jgi:alpha-ketoglutarate-dependent 2,4-dichlorophenoxyacetate dioxygenase